MYERCFSPLIQPLPSTAIIMTIINIYGTSSPESQECLQRHKNMLVSLQPLRCWCRLTFLRTNPSRWRAISRPSAASFCLSFSTCTHTHTHTHIHTHTSTHTHTHIHTHAHAHRYTHICHQEVASSLHSMELSLHTTPHTLSQAHWNLIHYPNWLTDWPDKSCHCRHPACGILRFCRSDGQMEYSPE